MKFDRIFAVIKGIKAAVKARENWSEKVEEVERVT
jgi:hypothetical protein